MCIFRSEDHQHRSLHPAPIQPRKPDLVQAARLPSKKEFRSR